MDERVRIVEGDVRSLKDWRATRVDPWLNESADFHEEFRTFMDQEKTRAVLVGKLQDERHQSNSFKLNLIAVIATILLALIGLATLMLSIATMRHQSMNPFNTSNSPAPVLSLEHQPELAGDPPAWVEEK